MPETLFVGRIQEKTLQRRVIRGVAKVMLRQVEGSQSLIARANNNHIAIHDIPQRPNLLAHRGLQPGEGSPGADFLIAGIQSNVVDADYLDRSKTRLSIHLGLQLVKEAKLASAVTSRRVAEIPSGNLPHVIARRNRLLKSGRIRVDIGQSEIRQRLFADFDHGFSVRRRRATPQRYTQGQQH